METLHAYQSLIKKNLDYDSLLVSHPHDKNQIELNCGSDRRDCHV